MTRVFKSGDIEKYNVRLPPKSGTASTFQRDVLIYNFTEVNPHSPPDTEDAFEIPQPQYVVPEELINGQANTASAGGIAGIDDMDLDSDLMDDGWGDSPDSAEPGAQAASTGQPGRIAGPTANEMQEILALAQQQGFDAGTAQGQQEGHQQGFESGKQEALAQSEVMQERYKSSIERVNSLFEQIIDHNRVNVVQLAIRVAKSIIQEEITVNPEKMLKIIQSASEKLENETSITLTVSPEDYEFMQQGPQMVNLSGIQKVNLIKDNDLERGDLVVAGNHATINARLDERLEAVEEELLQSEQSEAVDEQEE
jgi:flagellar biosynthesis/type III secretory pathway protein FliH